MNEDAASVELLLAAGANPDVPCKFGRTALARVVAMAGSLDEESVAAIVSALVAAGADRAKGRKELNRVGGGIDHKLAYLEPLLAGHKAKAVEGKC